MCRVVKNKDIVTRASTKQPPSKATHMDIMTIENKFIEDAISMCCKGSFVNKSEIKLIVFSLSDVTLYRG